MLVSEHQVVSVTHQNHQHSVRVWFRVGVQHATQFTADDRKWGGVEKAHTDVTLAHGGVPPVAVIGQTGPTGHRVRVWIFGRTNQKQASANMVSHVSSFYSELDLLTFLIDHHIWRSSGETSHQHFLWLFQNNQGPLWGEKSLSDLSHNIDIQVKSKNQIRILSWKWKVASQSDDCGNNCLPVVTVQ